MSRSRAGVLAGSLVCVMCLAGCGRVDQTTPHGAMKTMVKAMEKGDRPEFLACWDAAPEQAEVLDALLEMTRAANDLQEACKREFGREAWRTIEKRQGPDSLLTRDELAGVTVHIDGDTAEALKEGDNEPIHLVRKDGLWKIAADDILPPEKETEQAVKIMRDLTDAFKRVTDEVGKPGATAKDIERSLQAEMLKVMMGSVLKPD